MAAGGWQKQVLTNSHGNLFGVSYGNGLFVSGSDSSQIWASTDGVTWANKKNSNSPIYSCTYGGTWVAVGMQGELLYSFNGNSWSEGASIFGDDLTGVTANGSMYVAVSRKGNIYSSTDGVAWAKQLDTSGIEDFEGAAYGGGKFLAFGLNGAVYTSDSGYMNWTPGNIGASETVYGIAYGNGIYVAVTKSGKMYTSTDAVDWTGQDSPRPGNSLEGITYGAGTFVAVGGGGAIFTSKNGLDWADESDSSASGLIAVAYGGGKFVAVGLGGTVLTKTLSSDANLSKLTLSTGELTPAFSPGTTNYTASVGNDVTSIDLTTMTADSKATVTMKGEAVASGVAKKVNINEGHNLIILVVTAEIGTYKTYTVDVIRAAPSANADLSNLTLSAGTLSPVFSSGMTSYTSSVAYGVTSVDVTPTVADSTATVTVNGNIVTSGTAKTVNLNVGATPITILVTAQDGSTKTYTIIVTRAAPSANADLSNLTISTGTLSPAFSSGMTTYLATVAYGVHSVDITPTVADSTATVTVNGNSVTSGTASTTSINATGVTSIPIVVTAQNGSKKTYTIMGIWADPSTNANLSSLTLSEGTLSPTFASGTSSYTASVAHGVTSVEVTPTVADSTAALKVNGASVPSGSARSISLNAGANTVTIVVTAQNGSTQTYTITVTRAAASANADLSSLILSQGMLSPNFASETTGYTASVGNEVASVDITPTTADSKATMTVNGNPVSSGATYKVNLAVKVNPITVVVTAQNGSTKTYTVDVTRAASANANLSNLTVSEGTLSPVFVSGTTNYTADVANSVSSISVTPTVADSTATVKVNGASTTNGAPSTIQLNVGDNTITVDVTAQDGSTTQTYTITVTRAALASTNAKLSSMVLSQGTLSPTFKPDTVNYTANVANSVTSVDITPTVEDSNATVVINGNVTTSGKAASVSLNVGSNAITVLVTAQDGSTKTYTITVTRAGLTLPPPTPPTPPTPPVDNRTEPQKQIDHNEEAAEAIGEAKDKQAVLRIMDESFDQLKRLEKMDHIKTSDKLNVLQNAVTTLFEASMEKMNDGVISDKDVAKYIEELLEEHIASVVEDVPVDDHELYNLATNLLATVVDAVLSQLDEKRVEGKLADRFGNILTVMLNKVNLVEIDKTDSVSDLHEPIERVNNTLKTIFGKWDKGKDIIAFNKQIVLSMTREQSGVQLSSDAVDELADEKFNLKLSTADQAGMEVPAALLDTLKNKDLELSIEQAVEPPNAVTYTNASPMYRFTMRADGKEITKFGKSSVRVIFPYRTKSSNLQAYYYDEKQRSWKPLTDSRGNAIEVRKDGSIIYFDTPHFTQFMVAQAAVRSLTVKQSNVKLKPGESIQLNVTASLPGGPKTDVTKAEKGTVYESSNPDVLTVSEDGVLTAARETGNGSTLTATVTVRNGEKTAKVKVSLLSIRSLSVAAKKQTVAPGATLPLTVTVTFSDRSKLNVTKADDTQYSLDDDTYASIDDEGVLTVHDDAPAGTVITVKAEYQNIVEEYEVIVK